MANDLLAVHKTITGSTLKIRADFETSTAEDILLGLEGYELLPGSFAHVRRTGDFYELDDDGNWYKQDGSGEYLSGGGAE